MWFRSAEFLTHQWITLTNHYQLHHLSETVVQTNDYMDRLQLMLYDKDVNVVTNVIIALDELQLDKVRTQFHARLSIDVLNRLCFLYLCFFLFFYLFYLFFLFFPLGRYVQFISNFRPQVFLGFLILITANEFYKISYFRPSSLSQLLPN